MAKIPSTVIEALIYSRDYGSPWWKSLSEPIHWSTARARLVRRMVRNGYLESEHPGQITEAGLAVLKEAGLDIKDD